MKLVLANEATATKRRCYFHLVDATDGITAETGEAAGQPQVSSNGAAFTNTGIGTLSAIGNGRYYADMTQALVTTAGTQIETRYKSANTAESPGDSFQVVAFDPYDTVRMGMTALPNAAADAAGGLPISDAGGLAMDDIPITSEFNARTLPSADYVVVTDTIAGVTLATTCTTNTDMVAEAPTVGAVADQVWEETLADHSGTAGSTAEALNAAGAAGDPWTTVLPGAYGASSAGKIIGDNINAPLDVIDTVVDAILVDTADMQPRVVAIEVDTSTTIPGTITTAQNDLDIITGTDGVTLATAQGLYAPSKAGDLMGLANDAITSAKFDESTAHPVTAEMQKAGSVIATGTVSWDNTNATTTVIYCSDITTAAADHWNGRIMIFTSGTLLNQATDITDYELAVGEGKFTVTALTTAPADNVTFVIV